MLANRERPDSFFNCRILFIEMSNYSPWMQTSRKFVTSQEASVLRMKFENLSFHIVDDTKHLQLRQKTKNRIGTHEKLSESCKTLNEIITFAA